MTSLSLLSRKGFRVLKASRVPFKVITLEGFCKGSQEGSIGIWDLRALGFRFEVFEVYDSGLRVLGIRGSGFRGLGFKGLGL